jgi:hypothetical protein
MNVSSILGYRVFCRDNSFVNCCGKYTMIQHILTSTMVASDAEGSRCKDGRNQAFGIYREMPPWGSPRRRDLNPERQSGSNHSCSAGSNGMTSFDVLFWPWGRTSAHSRIGGVTTTDDVTRRHIKTPGGCNSDASKTCRQMAHVHGAGHFREGEQESPSS